MLGTGLRFLNVTDPWSHYASCKLLFDVPPQILTCIHDGNFLSADLVAMLTDPISFANRALQEMAEGLVSGM